jgi:hypothetical protein
MKQYLQQIINNNFIKKINKMKGRPLPIKDQIEISESSIKYLEKKMEDNPTMDYQEKKKLNYLIEEYNKFIKKLKEKLFGFLF